MSSPLLRTKLYIPPARSDLVSRARLVERLNQGLTRKLTLISASAGFGKTTLLSDWAAQSRVPVAWVSLDEGDNDPARFLTYLTAALQTVEANIGARVMGALAAAQPQAPSLEAILTALLNDIALVPDDLVLILDDYHVIQAQPIHQALTFLLDHLPPQTHMVIASRADPPLPLARLRGRGQLVELRVADLRFTPIEAATFLNQVMGLDLAAQEIVTLETRTEGWIVGLQLAALSLQGRQDTARFIQAFTGTHRYILDYLVEEVLQRQPEEIQTFLLETVILDRLTGPLCDAVTGQSDGQATLEQLEEANLFIVPLDDERRWYRYHRLFSDLLRARLNQTLSGRVLELHRRASAWYERNGLASETIGHALQAGDFERAAHLVEANALQKLTSGELTTLLGWLGALREEQIRSRPPLSVFYAWALLLTGQVGAVESWLQDAERGLDDLEAPASKIQDWLGHIAAIRAYVAALQGDAPRTVELAQRALERLPEDDLVVRSVVALTLGGATLQQGNLTQASRAFAEASTIGQAAGNVHVAVPALCSLASLRMLQAQLDRAHETFQEALGLAAGSSGGTSPVAAMVHSGLSRLTYEWNDLRAAERHALDSIEQSQLWGNVETTSNGYVTLAQVRGARGDLESALDALRRAERTISGHTVTPMTAARVAACRPRLWLSPASENLDAAVEWTQKRGLNVNDELDYACESEHLILARVLTAQGKLDEASALLTRLRSAAEEAGRTSSVIEILVSQALTFQAQSDLDRALTALEQALSLAEPGRFVRLFVDEGPVMETLLRQALSRDIASGYVRRLLAAFPSRTIDSSVVRHPSSPIEPLSERELQVLRLIAAGRSNREIAEELVVALGTVKAHTSNIYSKLGVRSRTQAVARARELELL